jgi:uncharacterized Fe-S radical SAM superfamily protein PflX
MLAPSVPGFRAVSFVGGEPAVNLPYVRALLPLLRRSLPDRLLVFNTNLYLGAGEIPWLARNFDWIVGDVHFGDPACSASIAGEAGYPTVARAAAESLLAEGARLLLRFLVLPGHLDCCFSPLLSWARSLQGDFLVRLLTCYAPLRRHAGHPELDRGLAEEERARARAMMPPDLPSPSPLPVPGHPSRRPGCVDAPSWIDLDARGRVFIPYVTGDLLPLAAALNPEFEAALPYLSTEG